MQFAFLSCRSSIKLELAPSLTERAQAQRIELDESLGIAVVVSHCALFESHEILVVERIFALAADNSDIAFVELELYAAGHKFLALVDCHLQHFALRREPETIIDQFGIFRHQLVFEMRSAAIDRSQEMVTGRVRVRLYKGNVAVVGRESKYSLYDQDLVTFEEGAVAYDQHDAEGFIRLNALRLRTLAQRKKKLGL